MTGAATIEAVRAWVREAVPQLVADYDYAPTTKTKALPDVVVDFDSSQVATEDADLPLSQIQQRHIKLRTLTLSFMVDNSDPQSAAALLRDFEDAATASVFRDGTLGGRVISASRLVSFDYSSPFVEYPDGTKGREMVMTLIVGEPVEVQ